jgi:hypothetical protein
VKQRYGDFQEMYSAAGRVPVVPASEADNSKNRPGKMRYNKVQV